MPDLISTYSSRVHHKPFFVTDLNHHTMGPSLLRYLEIKIHPHIKMESYQKIVVVGHYDRSAVIGDHEKNDKVTNWQRPTVKLEGSTLFVKCFPGSDYVRHYAAIIASYLALTGRDPKVVSYVLPTEDECWAPILDAGLEQVPISSMLITGYGLQEISGKTDLKDWNKTDKFLWTQTTINNKVVTFVIFQFSFWGDILERLTTHFANLGHKRMIFTAKVGGIRQDLVPNYHVVTGDLTYIEGEIITWRNLFAALKHAQLVKGTHYNSPSVLFENKDWHKLLSTFDFVDSEIGHFARAAYNCNLEFGYLHFIANNLTILLPEDLSNERDHIILEKRDQVKKTIRQLIEQVI